MFSASVCYISPVVHILIILAVFSKFSYKRCVSQILYIATINFSLSFTLVEVSIDAEDIGVVEGQTASVCVNVSESNLLDSTNPPTVRLSTAENGGIVRNDNIFILLAIQL